MTLEAHRQRFERRLAQMDGQFDEAAGLPAEPFSSPGYHTTLKGGMVHPTRSGVEYALALLDTGDPLRYPRACSIIEQILSLQDTDETHATYGIWSWFAEEPLSQMSPPDWNWADFIGKVLIQILLFHKDKLPAGLAQKTLRAVGHAARSIVRRDVTPDYTNIHIMGIYVTFLAGRLTADEAILQFGKNSMRRAVENLEWRGGIGEYNSPTYTVVAIQDCSLILRDFDDEETLRDARIFYEALWRMLAEHYHPSTGMLVGPHSRCYDDLMNEEYRQTVEEGLHPLPAGLRTGVSYTRFVRCPAPLCPLFDAGSLPREVVHCYNRQEGRTATTWLTGAFALGSFGHGDLWNQRRPLLAYFDRGGRTTYFKLRFLHDGYDFSSALTSVRQVRNRLVCGISLADDYGDTHINLDLVKDRTIRARSLRLRFETGGCMEGVRLPERLGPDGTLLFRIGGQSVRVQLLALRFGAFQFEQDGPQAAPPTESGRDGTGERKRREVLFMSGASAGSGSLAGGENGAGWFDLVLYEGEEREFRLDALGDAVVLFGMEIGSNDCQFRLRRDSGGLTALMRMNGREEGGVSLPSGAIHFADHVKACKVFAGESDSQ